MKNETVNQIARQLAKLVIMSYNLGYEAGQNNEKPNAEQLYEEIIRSENYNWEQA